MATDPMEAMAARIDAAAPAPTLAIDNNSLPLDFISFGPDWATDIAPRQWWLHEWIPHRQATYLTGPGSAGKSLLAQQLLTCTATERPFMGIETRQAVSLYVTAEDAIEELHRRQASINEAMGVRWEELQDRLHVMSWSDFVIDRALMRIGENGQPEKTALFDDLITTAKAIRARVIALDNVAHLLGGNENDRHHVAFFVHMMNRLASAIDGAVIFIGHPNKAGAEFSGSTAWENQVRSRLFMETPKDEDGACADPDLRVLTRAKANYARNGEEVRFRWHKWAFVRPEDLPPNVAEQLAETVKASADNELFLRCLDARNGQERAVSENPASRTYAPLVFDKMPESKGIGRSRLEAAMDRLFRVEKIERGYLWRADRKDRFGLRRKCADLRADPAPTGCADVRPVDAPTCALSHPYTTYKTGAAPSEAAAPSVDSPRRSARGEILAPGETGDEPVEGWG